MKLVRKTLVVGALLLFTSIKAVYAADDKHEISDIELNKLCPQIAIDYVTGNKELAQNLAKNLLTVVQSKHDKACSQNTSSTAPRLLDYEYTVELSMLKSVIADDERSVENYMENDFEPENMELKGFKFGLKEALPVHEKLLALNALEPLHGPASSAYLGEGCNVAAMMYLDNRKKEAKRLANKLLALLPAIRSEHQKNSEHPEYCSYEQDEKMLNGITNDDGKIVFRYAAGVAEDSIGSWLEQAYGTIYLYKRLKMDLDHLAYAYDRLGLAQAIAGNYDESERAYKMALRLAAEQYENNYPEILLWIRSEYAAMLKMAGKSDKAAKIAEGVTPEHLKELRTKFHRPDFSIGEYAPGWGP